MPSNLIYVANIENNTDSIETNNDIIGINTYEIAANLALNMVDIATKKGIINLCWHIFGPGESSQMTKTSQPPQSITSVQTKIKICKNLSTPIIYDIFYLKENVRR